MKKLSGYVLVKETNIGIPNLIVAAYDSENPIQAIRSMYETKETLSIESLGKRIGSVLTDNDGRFLLTAEDLEFQGNELRPDLIILVLAPEDVQSIDRPYPLSPEKRILYISAVAIADAGAEEAFVIRLLQAQLETFHISTDPIAKQGITQSNRLTSIVKDAWVFRDTMREQISPRLQMEQRRSDARRKFAQEQTKNLSAIPLHLRDSAIQSDRFLIRGKEDLKTNLKEKQRQAITDGLQRLAKLKPTLRLSLSTTDLASLGLRQDGDSISGEVDAATLAEKVRSLMTGVDLVRQRSLNTPDPDELERRYLSGTTTKQQLPNR